MKNETEPLEIEVTNMDLDTDAEHTLEHDQEYINNHYAQQTRIIHPDYDSNGRNITRDSTFVTHTRNDTEPTEMKEEEIDDFIERIEMIEATEEKEEHKDMRNKYNNDLIPNKTKQQKAVSFQIGSEDHHHDHPNHHSKQSTMNTNFDDKPLLIRLSNLRVNYDKPRYVYCAAELTLLKVDLQSQLFDAEITLKFYWQQPELARFLSKPKYKHRVWSIYDDQRSIPVDIDKPFDGSLALDWIEKKFSFDFSNNTVCMSLHLNDQFAERMALQRFPVDRQFLNILLMGRRNTINQGNWIWITNAPIWVPKMYHNNKYQIQSRLSPSVSDYKMYSPWADFRMIENGMDIQPPFKLRFRLQRYPGFYIGNIIIPLLLIIICCFASLVIPAENIADRLSVTITLMLATVAFRFVLTSLLPSVPYLTWLDYYITFSFMIVAAFIAENACAGFMPETLFSAEILDIHFIVWLCMGNIDRLFGLIVILSLCIVNIFFIVAMCTNVCRYSWKDMDKQDRESEDDDFVAADPSHIAGSTYDPINSIAVTVEPTNNQITSQTNTKTEGLYSQGSIAL